VRFWYSKFKMRNFDLSNLISPKLIPIPIFSHMISQIKSTINFLPKIIFIPIYSQINSNKNIFFLSYLLNKFQRLISSSSNYICHITILFPPPISMFSYFNHPPTILSRYWNQQTTYDVKLNLNKNFDITISKLHSSHDLITSN
jgi:hypothetical protein